jgi:hypothetical protein
MGMQRNYEIGPVALLLILAAFSVGMISAAVTNEKVNVGNYDPPNCANPCTISIINAQFGKGAPAVIEQGTTVIWKNDDPTPYTTTISSGSEGFLEIVVLQFQSLPPMVYNTPGIYSFSADSLVEGTLVVVVS